MVCLQTEQSDPAPGIGLLRCLLAEAIGTFTLTFADSGVGLAAKLSPEPVGLATSHQHKIKGPEAAYPVGATIAACGLVGKGLSGASMNPARSLGPALVSGATRHLGIYLAAPVIGAMFAVAAVRAMHGPAKEKDEQAARGEKNAP
jgi:glycerol uptake facilitator-like aquaporin